MTVKIIDHGRIKDLQKRAKVLGFKVSRGFTQDSRGVIYTDEGGRKREGLELVNTKNGQIVYSPFFAGNYRFAWTVSDLDRYLTSEEAHQYRLLQAQNILDNLNIKGEGKG